MKATSFQKGKTTFQILFVVLFQLTTTCCQFILYNTDQTFKINSFGYDCLNYHVYREKLAYQQLSDVVDEVISYCFPPTDDFDQSFEVFVDPLEQKLSFEQMRMANITALQLLSWSIPVEVIERYQIYLNEPTPSLNESFYNCTEGRFGLRCQYSFSFGVGMSFNKIVETAFHGRIAYPELSDYSIYCVNIDIYDRLKKKVNKIVLPKVNPKYQIIIQSIRYHSFKVDYFKNMAIIM
jgi:hypothetical protein